MTKRKTKTAVVAGAGLLALFAGSEAFAQVSPTTITQTATRLDAAQVGVSAGGVATNAQVTATVAAVANQYFYVSSLFAEMCQDATGTTNTLAQWTTTNLPGLPSPMVSGVSAANSCNTVQLNFSTPVKSLVPGTAVTFYSPAAVSHASYYQYIDGYYGQ